MASKSKCARWQADTPTMPETTKPAKAPRQCTTVLLYRFYLFDAAITLCRPGKWKDCVDGLDSVMFTPTVFYRSMLARELISYDRRQRGATIILTEYETYSL